MSYRIARLERQPVPQNRFLNRPSMVSYAVGQNLHPQMAHFIPGFVSCPHAFRRVVWIARILHGVVVMEAHGYRCSSRKEQRLPVTIYGLQVQITKGNEE